MAQSESGTNRRPESRRGSDLYNRFRAAVASGHHAEMLHASTALAASFEGEEEESDTDSSEASSSCSSSAEEEEEEDDIPSHGQMAYIKRQFQRATRKTNRSLPNILITGTPGTGKTSLSAMVAAATKLSHINLGAKIGNESLYDEIDEEFDSFVLNEDKVCDALEPLLSEGGYIVDFHSCDFFPERWFDLIVVLRADNTVLYDRLKERGYKQNKIQENVQCEIMQVVWEEAVESYEERKILERQSNTEEEMQATIDLISTIIDHVLADEPNKRLKMSHPESNPASLTMADVSRLTSQNTSGRSSVLDEGDR